MKSGQVYFGEKIDESGNSIKIKEWNSDFIVEIDKESIDTITPAVVIVTSKNNFEILGTIQSKTADNLKIKTSEGVSLDIAKKDIQSVEYLNHSYKTKTPIRNIKGVEEKELQNKNHTPQKHILEIKNATEKQNQSSLSSYSSNSYEKYFPFLGIGFGSPGVINLVAGYHFDRVLFKVHGGADNLYGGIQSSLLLNIYETNDCDFSLSIGTCFGFWSRKKERRYTIPEGNINREYLAYYYDDFWYSGGLFQIQLHGITFEAGVATPILSENPDINQTLALLNLGYVYYFN